MVMVALTIIPLLADSAYAGSYIGAYPYETARDADKIYMTSDFSGTSSSVTNNVFAIMSSANADSSGTMTGYMSQLYIVYDDNTDDLEMYSEVHGINTSGNSHEPYNCQDSGNTCQDFGNASNIVDVDSIMYWYSGEIKYYSYVDIKVGSDTYGFNTNYDPDDNSNESPTQFQSGKVADHGITFKLTQWGIESNTSAEADNWDIKLSNMKTYDGNYSNLVDDTTKTTDYTAGSTHGSYITSAYVNGYINMKIGEADYCVDRNGNTDGIIDLDDVSSGCLSVPTTLWS